MQSSSPLIAHVIFNMRAGGLENGLVNLINRMPEDRYRHAVVCIKDFSDFRFRVKRSDVDIIAMHKKEGKDVSIYAALYRLFREMRPTIVHSRNLAGLESLWPAWFAGVPGRIYAEHGRDMVDLHGGNRKHRLLRHLHRPVIDRFVAVSKDLAAYLHRDVGIPDGRIRQIYNGVDTDRFRSTTPGRAALTDDGFAEPDSIVIGSVSRLQQVKDPLNLVRAFALLRERAPDLRSRLRLAIPGYGPLEDDVAAALREAGAQDAAWLPGFLDDVPAVLRGLDVFVLPSLAEGVSNTILEAMASALPVVATDVGGNAEIVDDGSTGTLVPPSDPEALSDAIEAYARDPDLARRHGAAGRRRVEERFSLERMVTQYQALYDDVVATKGHLERPA